MFAGFKPEVLDMVDWAHCITGLGRAFNLEGSCLHIVISLSYSLCMHLRRGLASLGALWYYVAKYIMAID